MAKNSSILKIEGTLDGMTFYKTADGHIVRTKGGVSKSRIMSDPAYIRTRENMQEFSSVAQSVKILRHSLASLLRRGKDSKVSSRLMSVLSKVKKLDSHSLRGLRKVGEGITTNEGKALLTGFDFNKRAPLQQVLLAPYVLDTATGSIQINDFIPLDHLNIPEGATHVSLSDAVLNLDFISGSFDLQISPIANLALDMNSSNIDLVPASMPSGTGTQLYLLLIEFFQEVNGIQYSLRNGAFNVLHLVSVI